MKFDQRTYEIVDVTIAEECIHVLYTNWQEPDPTDFAPQTMHTHDYYELHASIGSDVVVRVNGKLVRIHDRQVLIIAPGTRHKATMPEARRNIFYYDPCNVSKDSPIRPCLTFTETYVILDDIDTTLVERAADEGRIGAVIESFAVFSQPHFVVFGFCRLYPGSGFLMMKITKR